MKRRLLDSALQRTAKEVKRYRIVKKLLSTIGTSLAILIVIVYIISVLYSRYGSFTVSVNKFNNLQYSITLSETSDFAVPTARLNCKAAAEVTNIDGNELDMKLLGRMDGEDNGANYLCYTFYLKNSGRVGVNVDYSMILANTTQNLDDAIRVRLISSRDEEARVIRDYAKAAGVDENHVTYPEPNTIAFDDNYTIMKDTIMGFMPDEVCKFTVVVWIEGNDPQCTNDKIGGIFKTDMKFNITGVVDDQEAI